MKIRKISGRHQIAADGRHLVDGMPFGRYLLRGPVERPVIKIPPRKRPRITYREEEETDSNAQESFLAQSKRQRVIESPPAEENRDRQLVVHAELDDEDDEDDEDFVESENNDESEDDEFDSDPEVETEENLQSSKSAHGIDSIVGSPADAEGHILEDITDESSKKKIRKLHSAFPSASLAVCKHIFIGSEGDILEAYDALSIGFRPEMYRSAFTVAKSAQGGLKVSKNRSKTREESAQQADMDADEDDESEDSNPVFNRFDQQGFPSGSITSGKGLHAMADVLKSSLGRTRSNSIMSNKSVRFANEDNIASGLTETPLIDQLSQEESSDSSSDSDSSEEEDVDKSVDGPLPSDSDAESEEDESKEKADTDSSSSDSDSDSSEESSSDSDDAPEEISSKPKPVASTPLKTQTASERNSVRKVPPGSGQKRTQARNQRRRNHDLLDRYQKKGILPASTTLAEFTAMDLPPNSSADDGRAALEAIRSTKISTETSKAQKQRDEFEVRREMLMAQLAEGGIPVGEDSIGEDELLYKPRGQNLRTAAALQSQKAPDVLESEMSEVAPEEPQPASTSASSAGKSNPEVIDNSKSRASNGPSRDPIVTEASADPRVSITPTFASRSGSMSKQIVEYAKNPSSGRRADANPARRMIFSHLGIKAPKTDQEKEIARNKLMGKATSARIGNLEKIVPPHLTVEEDPDAWKEVINYRAVECCHEGVLYSEPPFPFVQRWDPQQQNGQHKRKRHERAQSQFYEEQPTTKKQKNRKSKNKQHYAEEREYHEASYEPSYQGDSSMETENHTQKSDNHAAAARIEEQTANSVDENMSQAQQPDDLTPLPKDPSSLPDLKPGEAKVGMTIAFKWLTFNESTRYQPEISAYRTAIITFAPEGGDLHLALAQRDRKTAEIKYDEETGEPIYGKFDAPIDEEIEIQGEEHDGQLVCAYSTLIEPKVLAVHTPNIADTQAPDRVSTENGELSPEESVTMSQGEEAVETQVSHVTETCLNSDAPEPIMIQMDTAEQDENNPTLREPTSSTENFECNRATNTR